MSEVTTIQIDKKILEKLKESKEYPEQTYNSLLGKMVEIFNEAKKRNAYDKYLHYIQKQKMKELWDNKEDEEWEHA